MTLSSASRLFLGALLCTGLLHGESDAQSFTLYSTDYFTDNATETPPMTAPTRETTPVTDPARASGFPPAQAPLAPPTRTTATVTAACDNFQDFPGSVRVYPVDVYPYRKIVSDCYPDQDLECDYGAKTVWLDWFYTTPRGLDAKCVQRVCCLWEF